MFKINDDILIGIIIAVVTIASVIMFLLHVNDAIYPGSWYKIEYNS